MFHMTICLIRKIARFERFFLFGPYGLAIVLSVVGVTFELPEVGPHGLVAARLVLLGEERCLVRGDLREIFHTGQILH